MSSIWSRRDLTLYKKRVLCPETNQGRLREQTLGNSVVSCRSRRDGVSRLVEHSVVRFSLLASRTPATAYAGWVEEPTWNRDSLPSLGSARTHVPIEISCKSVEAKEASLR